LAGQCSVKLYPVAILLLPTPPTLTPDNSISRITLDSDTPDDDTATPSTTRASKKRKKRDNCWNYARKPIPMVELEREKSGKEWRKIWYCGFLGCEKYKVLSTAAARAHLQSIHRIMSEPATPAAVSVIHKTSAMLSLSRNKS
jgi:hypothetical protein